MASCHTSRFRCFSSLGAALILPFVSMWEDPGSEPARSTNVMLEYLTALSTEEPSTVVVSCCESAAADSGLALLSTVIVTI